MAYKDIPDAVFYHTFVPKQNTTMYVPQEWGVEVGDILSMDIAPLGTEDWVEGVLLKTVKSGNGIKVKVPRNICVCEAGQAYIARIRVISDVVD